MFSFAAVADPFAANDIRDPRRIASSSRLAIGLSDRETSRRRPRGEERDDSAISSRE